MKLPWSTPSGHRRFIKIDGQKTVLDHYAARTWAGSNHGAVQLFEHSHARMPATDRSCDVGVDAWNLVPVGIDQIRAYLATQPPFRNAGDPAVPTGGGDEETSTEFRI